MELYFGEKDGQRDSRKASSRAEVHNLCPRSEADYLGYAQRMQHMVFVQVLYIFAWNDINLRVPVHVEVVEGGKLPFLFFRQVREIFEY